jgi:hypothetical protein
MSPELTAAELIELGKWRRKCHETDETNITEKNWYFSKMA